MQQSLHVTRPRDLGQMARMPSPLPQSQHVCVTGITSGRLWAKDAIMAAARQGARAATTNAFMSGLSQAGR